MVSHTEFMSTFVQAMDLLTNSEDIRYQIHSVMAPELKRITMHYIEVVGATGAPAADDTSKKGKMRRGSIGDHQKHFSEYFEQAIQAEAVLPELYNALDEARMSGDAMKVAWIEQDLAQWDQLTLGPVLEKMWKDFDVDSNGELDLQEAEKMVSHLLISSREQVANSFFSQINNSLLHLVNSLLAGDAQKKEDLAKYLLDKLWPMVKGAVQQAYDELVADQTQLTKAIYDLMDLDQDGKVTHAEFMDTFKETIDFLIQSPAIQMQIEETLWPQLQPLVEQFLSKLEEADAPAAAPATASS